MEIKQAVFNLKNKISGQWKWLRTKFVHKSSVSGKSEINFLGYKWVFLSGLTLFVAYVLLSPEEPKREFTQKLKDPQTDATDIAAGSAPQKSDGKVSGLWSSGGNLPHGGVGGGSGGSQVNYNTPMVLNSKFGNARTQFRAGTRIPLKIVDKFVVSQDAVPILAESILDSVTESGIRIPAGTRFYGEASFSRGSERCDVNFKQISLPSGEIKPISALGIGKDGQPGLGGHVRSDGMKNTAGQLITSFVGGFASGSMQTDPFGRSRGGVENGLLSAVADTTKAKAQDYGQKLQTQREWIEVEHGVELDALLKDTLNLNEGGNL